MNPEVKEETGWGKTVNTLAKKVRTLFDTSDPAPDTF
jgi:hypothetical protein